MRVKERLNEVVVDQAGRSSEERVKVMDVSEEEEGSEGWMGQECCWWS